MLVLAVHVEWCCRFSLAVVVDNVLVVLLIATVFFYFFVGNCLTCGVAAVSALGLSNAMLVMTAHVQHFVVCGHVGIGCGCYWLL